MVETLKIIKRLREAFEELSNDQILYILGELYNISFSDCSISSFEKTQLCGAGIIVNNELAEPIKEAFTKVITYNPNDNKKEDKKESLNKFSKESKKVFTLLYDTFVGPKVNKDTLAKYQSYMNDTTTEAEPAKALLLFLNLMPTPSAINNKRWNKAFSTTYKGVTLRRLTKDTAKKFKKLYLKKSIDTGLLCLALFKFVKDGVNDDGKCFIRKIDSFFAEFDTWYEEAKESCEKFNKVSTSGSETSVAGRKMV